jgi:hypothetical protein
VVCDAGGQAGAQQPPGSFDEDRGGFSRLVVAGVDHDLTPCQGGFKPFAGSKVNPVFGRVPAEDADIVAAGAELAGNLPAECPGPAYYRDFHALVTTQPPSV